MPTYDYVCTQCGHRMEVMHSVHGHGPSACPVCGSPMKKAYAPPTVHFKGTGWARKERSSTRSGKPADQSGSSGTADAGSSSSSGSDTGSSSGSSTSSGAESGAEKSSGSPSGTAPKERD